MKLAESDEELVLLRQQRQTTLPSPDHELLRQETHGLRKIIAPPGTSQKAAQPGQEFAEVEGLLTHGVTLGAAGCTAFRRCRLPSCGRCGDAQ